MLMAMAIVALVGCGGESKDKNKSGSSDEANEVVTYTLDIPEKAEPLYNVGDYYNQDGLSGVIFWVDGDGEHGLLVAMSETRAQWCTDDRMPSQRVAVGASHFADGRANNDAVLSHDASYRFPAFEWCAKQGDAWYIPAVNEMKELCRNLGTINDAIKANGGTPISQALYATSTEKNSCECYYFVAIDGGSGYHHYSDKADSYLVRPIAAF